MESARRIFLALLLLSAAWAVEPRVAMVLEVKGQATVAQEGRTRPLRTLQVLPEGAVLSVANNGQLRLTYFASGLRETLIGPLQATAGTEMSGQIEGEGKLTSEPSAGSKTMVPKSENMRRMGGARQAMLELDADELLYKLPDKPRLSVSRTESKLGWIPFAPSFAKIPAGREIAWTGQPPYRVTLLADEQPLLDLPSSASSVLPLSKLDSGRLYKLSVTDGRKDSLTAEFYLLSEDERAEVRRDLRRLSRENRAGRTARLVAQIAYLEGRGLWNEALPLAREAVRTDGDDIGLRLALGRLQIKLGLYDAAEKTLNRALELEKGEATP